MKTTLIRTTPAMSPRHHFLATRFAVLGKANQDPPRHLLHLRHTTRSMPIDDLETALPERASTISTWRTEIRRHLAGCLGEVARWFTGEHAISIGDRNDGTARRFPGPGKKHGLED